MNYNEDIHESIQMQHELYNGIVSFNSLSNSMRMHMGNTFSTDLVEFYTPSNEYKIVFSKRKKAYSQYMFSQYICTVEFRDKLNRPVISINTSEKDFLRMAEEISLFLDGYGYIYDSMVPFGEYNGEYWFLFLGYTEYLKDPVEYPTDNDDNIGLSFYSGTSDKGNVLRLYFESNIENMQEFVHYIYQILVDIPYVNEMVDYTVQELYQSVIGNS